MPWKIVYDDDTYLETDITIGQMERIEQLTDMSWRHVTLFTSAKAAVAVAAVLVSDRTRRPFEQVLAEVREKRLTDFLSSVDTVTDDLPTMYTDGNPPQAGE